MTYRELQQALAVFGLNDRATLREIKKRHRELVRQHHPDTGQSGDPDRIRQINEAYRIIAGYCGSYNFSFSEAEFYEQNPEERLRMQFAHVPLWGES